MGVAPAPRPLPGRRGPDGAHRRIPQLQLPCRRRLPHFLLSAVLILAALRSARGLPLVALIALPITNAALTRALRSARNLRPRLRSALDSLLAYSDGLR